MELVNTLNSVSTGISRFTLDIGRFSLQAEEAIRLWGKIPFIGMAVGAVRGLGAGGQLLLAKVSLLSTGLSAIATYCLEKAPDMTDHLLQAEIAVRMGVHSFLNGIRANIEFIPFMNLLLIPYDLIMDGQLFGYVPTGGIPAWAASAA